MIATAATILVVLWVIGMLTGYVMNGFTHLLMLSALIMMAVTTVSRRRAI